MAKGRGEAIWQLRCWGSQYIPDRKLLRPGTCSLGPVMSCLSRRPWVWTWWCWRIVNASLSFPHCNSARAQPGDKCRSRAGLMRTITSLPSQCRSCQLRVWWSNPGLKEEQDPGRFESERIVSSSFVLEKEGELPGLDSHFPDSLFRFSPISQPNLHFNIGQEIIARWVGPERSKSPHPHHAKSRHHNSHPTNSNQVVISLYFKLNIPLPLRGRLALTLLAAWALTGLEAGWRLPLSVHPPHPLKGNVAMWAQCCDPQGTEWEVMYHQGHWWGFWWIHWWFEWKEGSSTTHSFVPFGTPRLSSEVKNGERESPCSLSQPHADPCHKGVGR